MNSPIHFYAVDAPFGVFSNHSPHEIVIAGCTWPTVEHYFQAQKFAATPHEEEIRSAPDAACAAAWGRQRHRPLRADWDAVKDSLMRAAVLAKFSQHEDARHALLDTGDASLIEHTAADRYWGDGGDGSGLNKLGLILMEARDLLRRSHAASKP